MSRNSSSTTSKARGYLLQPYDEEGHKLGQIIKKSATTAARMVYEEVRGGEWSSVLVYPQPNWHGSACAVVAGPEPSAAAFYCPEFAEVYLDLVDSLLRLDDILPADDDDEDGA